MDSANHFLVSATAHGDRVTILKTNKFVIGITNEEAINLACHLLARANANLAEVARTVEEIKNS